VSNWTSPDIDFNERFDWNQAYDMSNSYKCALQRGLPYPILTVAEYFSLGQEGFTWGGQYRAAGYYASILLWSSFAFWLLMNLLLVAVPRYGAYMMSVTGFLLVLTDIGYYMMLPKRPLTIVIEGTKITFQLGWCFWLVLVAGMLCLIIGLTISIIDLVWPHRFSTILEVSSLAPTLLHVVITFGRNLQVYYDTPYDRHVILEESHDVRYRKRNSKSLEDHPGLGSRILRRLSSKTREQTMLNKAGIDNSAFQNDAPKSPWRYAFRKAPPRGIQRTISQDSTSSMASAVAGMASSSNSSQSLHKQALSRMLP
jgi:dual oxidase maturation factor 1